MYSSALWPGHILCAFDDRLYFVFNRQNKIQTIFSHDLLILLCRFLYTWFFSFFVLNMEGLKSYTIDGLQPIPRASVNKGMAVMLVEQTKEVLEEYFVYVHQYGGDNKT